MLNNNQTFIGCDKDYKDADIIVFGAPFDGTASFRPGSRFASSSMRSLSIGIETYSPYQEKDLSEINVCDSGDLDLPFGNTENVLKQIENYTKQIIDDKKMPVMIGGEHLVTLGAVRALAKKHSDLHIIHFDAHADLRDDYLGEKLSHATVMHRVHDIVGDNKIYQFGIRSGDKYEYEFSDAHTLMQQFNVDGFDKIVERLKGKPVYFSLDLDVLDPSLFPGTGTPEAGGITFDELLDAVQNLNRLNIVGCDINELSPVHDQSDVSTLTACKILRELLLVLGGK
jgi:agmatinase